MRAHSRFSTGCGDSRARTARLALNNWPFDVPAVMPSRSPISSCVNPSMSCSTSTARYPGASAAIASSRSTCSGASSMRSSTSGANSSRRHRECDRQFETRAAYGGRRERSSRIRPCRAGWRERGRRRAWENRPDQSFMDLVARRAARVCRRSGISEVGQDADNPSKLVGKTGFSSAAPLSVT